MSVAERLGHSRHAEPHAFVSEFARDVHDHLTKSPRQLPSKYLYDDLGSALFEAICRLPWYPISRAEQRLLDAHGRDIGERLGPITTIVELGSGSGEKLGALIRSAGLGTRPLDIDLVDLSGAALELATRTLGTFETLRVFQHRRPYEAGLADAAGRFTPDDRVLVLFLGSNIGNFDPPACDAFLRSLRGHLRTGDQMLLGADLVKREIDLQLAYDDPLGVTAAFNRNLLVRVNRELGGNFAVDRFAHRAIWNSVASRMEMHLVAGQAQHVRVAAARVAFDMAAGDTIWTESSYKYEPETIDRLLDVSGFGVSAQWIDPADRFSLTLAEAR